MLAFFRKHAHSTIAKVLLTLLLLTLVIWGVGDMMRNPGGRQYAFKVGDVVTTESMWRDAVRVQTQQLQGMSGQEIDVEDLKKAGFYKELLNRMIDRSLLLAEAKSLGLTVSDDMAKLYLTTQPPLLDEKGKFSKDKLDSMLKQSGVSEEQLVGMVKEDIMHDNLIATFANPLLPPQFVEVLVRAINAARKVTMYEVTVDQVQLNDQPTDSALKELYEQNKDQFYVPEQRDVRAAALKLDTVAQSDVTDDELKEVYEQRKEMMKIPARRSIQHIVFSSIDQAKAAKKALDGGKSWQDVVKEFAPTQKLETQMVVKEALPPQLGGPVFNTPKGKVTDIIEANKVYALFYIVNELPAGILTFDQVKPELKKQYIKEKRYGQFSEIAKNIEADIEAGNDFNTITDKYKMVAQKVSLIEGQSFTGDDLSKSEELYKQAFATDINAISGVTPFGDDQFFIVTVDSNVPRKQKEFADVQPELTQRWIKENKMKIAEKAMAALTDALEKGEDWSKSADLTNVKVAQRQVKLSRGSAEGMPQDWIGRTLALKAGEVSGIADMENRLVVAKVDEVVAVSQDALKQLNGAPRIDRLQAELIKAEYLNALRKKFKIDVNQEIVAE